MKRLAIVSILLVGCSSADSVESQQGDAAADVGQMPTLDAGADADGAVSPPRDADAGSTDAGSDARAEPSIDAGRDATVDAGSVDAPPAIDVADAGARIDAEAGAVDADAASPPGDVGRLDVAVPDAPIDAPTDSTLPCTASPATCDSVNRYETAIRATFTQPCVTDAHQCGGLVLGGVVDTVPMTCKAGAWSLAWCLNAACYGCSMQCPANQLCDP